MKQAMLNGIRIVDMTSVVFGPYATMLLADLGADVIKVEAPGGDVFRTNGRAAKSKGMGPGFMALNRGKRAVTLDLKQAHDLDAMKRLIGSADVFIHNVRGKGMQKLGLDHASVARPGLIYVHCTGFGQDGPYAELQAYDDVVQAASGACTLLPRADGDPRPRYLPTLVADKVAGLHAAYATLAAIVHKLRTGEGQFVEVPLFESFANFHLNEHLAGLTFDPPNAPEGYQRQLMPDRQPFPTKDGHVSLVTYTDQSLFDVLAMLGDPDFLQQPDFATARQRWASLGRIYQRVAELTAAFTTADLLAMLRKADIPAQAVRDLGDMLEEPHLKATDFFRRREHPSEGPWHELRPAVRFGVPLEAPSHPPLPDEHGAEVRATLADGRLPWRDEAA